MSILQYSVSFYLKRGAATGHSFFLIMFLLEDQLESFIISCRVIFLTGWLKPSFLSGVEQIIFDSSYLLRTITVMEFLSYTFDFFKSSLFISPLQLQPSILWSRVYVFCRRRDGSHPFLFTLTGEFAVIDCLSNPFSSSMFIFKKKVGFSYAVYNN